MATEAKLIVTGQTAGAVSEILKLVAAQQKMETGAKDVTHAHQKHNEILAEMGGRIQSVTRGIEQMVTAFFSFEGIKKVLEDVHEQLNKIREARAQFWEGGGANVASMPVFANDQANLEKQLIGMSTGFGMPMDRVQSLVAQVARHARVGTAPSSIYQQSRDVLQFGQLTGENPDAEFAVVKALQDAFPQLTTQKALGLSLGLRDEGAMAVGEQQGALQNMLVPAQMLGIGPEQLAALAEIAARSGGSSSAVGKAIMTATTKIPELIEKGALKPDTSIQGYFEQMNSMQQQNPAALADVMREVGPKSAAAISLVASHPEMFAQGMQHAADYETGAPLTNLSKLMDKNWAFQATLEEARAKQGAANAKLTANQKTQEAAHQAEMTTQGIEAFYGTHVGPLNSLTHLIVGGENELGLAPWGKTYARIAQGAGVDQAGLADPIRGMGVAAHPTTAPSTQPSTQPGGLPVTKAAEDLSRTLLAAQQAAANLAAATRRPHVAAERLPGGPLGAY